MMRKQEVMKSGSLLAMYFSQSKPFWEDSFHKLERFACCKFSQEVRKNCDEPIKQMNWMMNIVAFCSTCTTRDLWTIHGQMEYILL
jgi:hypothetical protein